MKNYLILLILIFIILLLNINKQKKIGGTVVKSTDSNNYELIQHNIDVVNELNINNFKINFTTNFKEIYLNRKTINQIYVIKAIHFNNHHLGANPTTLSEGRTYLTTDNTFYHRFYIREGLIPGINHISFESVDKPNYYLRQHSNFLKLHNNETIDIYKKDATFIITESLGGYKNYISLRNLNYPTYYIQHQDYNYYVTNRDYKTYGPPADQKVDYPRFDAESSLYLEPINKNVLPDNTTYFNIYPVSSITDNINYKNVTSSFIINNTNNHTYKLANNFYDYFIFNNIAQNVINSTKSSSKWNIIYDEIKDAYTIENNTQSLIQLIGNKFKIKNNNGDELRFDKGPNLKFTTKIGNGDIFKLDNIIENSNSKDILCDILNIKNNKISMIDNNNPSIYNGKDYDLKTYESDLHKNTKTRLLLKHDNDNQYFIKNISNNSYLHYPDSLLNYINPIEIKVISRGMLDTDGKSYIDLVEFHINGKRLPFEFSNTTGNLFDSTIRGFNIVTINNSINELNKYSFDTYSSNNNKNESIKLSNFINTIENEKIIIIAVRDEASAGLLDETRDLFKTKLKSKLIYNLGYQDSYVLIVQKIGTTFKNIYEKHKSKQTGSITKNLILDFNILSCAYALKQLYDTYNGPILQIKNSDEEKADIYFDKYGCVYSIDILDNSQLLEKNNISLNNFSANKMYIIKWYDQSNNNNHLVAPSDNTYLAELTLDEDTNKYRIYFNDNKIKYTTQDINFNNENHTVFMKYKMIDKTNTNQNIFYINNTTTNNVVGYSVGQSSNNIITNTINSISSMNATMKQNEKGAGATYYKGTTGTTGINGSALYLYENYENIIVHYNNKIKSLYDGRISKTQDEIPSQTQNNTSSILGIGNDSNNKNAFNGYIDHLIIYNDQLTDTLKKSIYEKLPKETSCSTDAKSITPLSKDLIWSGPNVRYENINYRSNYKFTFKKYIITDNNLKINIEKKTNTLNTYYISYKIANDIFYLSNSNFNGMLVDNLGPKKENNEFIIIPYSNKWTSNLYTNYIGNFLKIENIKTIMPSYTNNKPTYNSLGMYNIYSDRYYIGISTTNTITVLNEINAYSSWHILKNNDIYYIYNEITDTFLGHNNISNLSNENYFNIEFNIKDLTTSTTIKSTIIDKYLKINSGKIVNGDEKVKWTFKRTINSNDAIIFKMKNNIITINSIKKNIYSNLLLSTYYKKLYLLNNDYELNMEHNIKMEYIDIINYNIINKLNHYNTLYNINLDYINDNLDTLYIKSRDLNECLIKLNYLLDIEENIKNSNNYETRYINKPEGILLCIGNDISNKYNLSISINKKTYLNNGPMHYFNTENNNIDVIIYSSKNFIIIEKNTNNYNIYKISNINYRDIVTNKTNSSHLILNLSYANNSTYNITNNNPIESTTVGLTDILKYKSNNFKSFRLEKIPNIKYLFYIYFLNTDNKKEYKEYLNDDGLTPYPKTLYKIVPVDVFKKHIATPDVYDNYYLNINNNINNLNILLGNNVINLIKKNSTNFEFTYTNGYFNIRIGAKFLGKNGELYDTYINNNTKHYFKMISYNNPFSIIGSNNIYYNNRNYFIKNENLIHIKNNTYYLSIDNIDNHSIKFSQKDNNITTNYPNKFLWKLSYIDSIKNPEKSKTSTTQTGGNPRVTYYITDKVYTTQLVSIPDLGYLKNNTNACVILYDSDIKKGTQIDSNIQAMSGNSADTSEECSQRCNKTPLCYGWAHQYPEGTDKTCWLTEKVNSNIIFQKRPETDDNNKRNAGYKCDKTYYNNVWKINVPINVKVTIYDEKNYGKNKKNGGISHVLLSGMHDLTNIRYSNTEYKWNVKIASVKVEQLQTNRDDTCPNSRGLLDSNNIITSTPSSNKTIEIISTGMDWYDKNSNTGIIDLVELYIEDPEGQNRKRVNYIDNLKIKLYVNNNINIKERKTRIEQKKRGLHVIILDDKLNTEIYSIFDTHESASNAIKFAELISSIDNTKTIIIAVYDEAQRYLGKIGKDTLLSLGASVTYMKNFGYRHSYILIATKYKKIAEKYTKMSDRISIKATLSPAVDSLRNKTTCAYALKKLFTDYTGPIVQIKSNTIIADIYFDYSGDICNIKKIPSQKVLSIENIKDTMYIEKWYDQSNNGNHLIPYENNPILIRIKKKYHVKFDKISELKIDVLNNFNGKINSTQHKNNDTTEIYRRYPHTIYTKYKEDSRTDEKLLHTNLFYIVDKERKKWGQNSSNISFHTRWNRVGANYYFFHNDILPVDNSGYISDAEWNAQNRKHKPLLNGELVLSYNGNKPYIENKTTYDVNKKSTYNPKKYNKHIYWNGEHQDIWCYNPEQCDTDILNLNNPLRFGIGNYLPRLTQGYTNPGNINEFKKWQFYGTMEYFILFNEDIENYNSTFANTSTGGTILSDKLQSSDYIVKDKPIITQTYIPKTVSTIDITKLINSSSYEHRFKLTNTYTQNKILDNIILKKYDNKYVLKNNNKYINIGTDTRITYNTTPMEFNINTYNKLFNNTFLHLYKSNKSISNVKITNTKTDLLYRNIDSGTQAITFDNNSIYKFLLHINQNIIEVDNFVDKNTSKENYETYISASNNTFIIEQNNMNICAKINDNTLYILDNSVIDISNYPFKVTDVNKYFNSSLNISNYNIKKVKENKLIHLQKKNPNEDLILSLVNKNLILYHQIIYDNTCIYFNVLVNKQFDFTTKTIILKCIPYNGSISLQILCDNYLFDYIENININPINMQPIDFLNYKYQLSKAILKNTDNGLKPGYRYKITTDNITLNSIKIPINKNISFDIIAPRFNIETGYISDADTSQVVNKLLPYKVEQKIIKNDIYDLIVVNNNYRFYNQILNSYIGENIINSDTINNTNIDFNIENIADKYIIRNVKSNKVINIDNTPTNTYLSNVIIYSNNIINKYTFTEVTASPTNVIRTIYNEKYLPKHNCRYRIKHIKTNKYLTVDKTNNNYEKLILKDFDFNLDNIFYQDFYVIYENNSYIFITNDLDKTIIGRNNIIYNPDKNTNYQYISFKLENHFVINNAFTIKNNIYDLIVVNNNIELFNNNININSLKETLNLQFSFELIDTTPLDVQLIIKNKLKFI